MQIKLVELTGKLVFGCLLARLSVPVPDRVACKGAMDGVEIWKLPFGWRPLVDFT